MSVEPKRDRWGRPLITPAGGGKPVAYTRATTLAKTLEDEASLANWKMRQVAVGLARRPDLVALASTTDDKRRLDDITQQALDAAASSARANVGTALHAVIERINHGEPTGDLLPALAGDVEAYRAGTADLTLSMPETFVVHDTWRVAGTFDFLVEYGGMLMIGDLKTGADLSYSWRSIAVQLAVYANAEWVYDPATDTRTPMPEVEKRIGVIVHLPAGENRCQLYTIDIAQGYEAAERSLWCRQWRRTELAEPFTPAAPAAPAPGPVVELDETRIVWLRDRAAALIVAGHGDTLAARWPAGVPTFRQGITEPPQLDAIEALLWDLEARTGRPFPPEQPDATSPVENQHGMLQPAPAPVVDEGDRISDDDQAAIAAALGRLDPPAAARVATVAAEAHTAGASLNVRLHPTRRRWTIARALIALAITCGLDDTATRTLIAQVTGRNEPGPLGAVIAALTIDEAERLAEATHNQTTQTSTAA